MSKTILVAGRSGMIGNAIQQVLSQSGNKSNSEKWIFMSSKDCDLRMKSQVQSFFEKHRPTHIIYLAANVGG